jgi:aminoethylphosphonate catabolism LysR family transcriptional regulator
MRHSQLRAFHSVAQQGGFSRAAEALHLTQPAVSEQVRRLEQAHDVLLFHREGRRVALTRAGEALFQLTKRYFEIETQIDAQLSRSAAVVEGELRILADSAVHVAGILSRFRARYPKVSVTLRSGNTEAILGALRNYDAEIGVVGSLPEGGDLVSLDLGASPIVAFALRGLSGGAAMPIAELAAHPLIFREKGSKTRQQVVEAAAAQGVRLRAAIEAEGRDAVRALVLSGAGVGFVSRAEYSPDPRLELVEIADLAAAMRESIVHVAARGELRQIRAFMEIARAG